MDDSIWRVNDAKLMLNYVDIIDETIVLPIHEPVGAHHYPVLVNPQSPNWRQFVVWSLEAKFFKNLGVLMQDTCDRSLNFMARCNHMIEG